MLRFSRSAPVDQLKRVGRQRKPEASVLMLRFSRFASVDQLKRVGKLKETRSVSEGFFDFSLKPQTRYAGNTSASPHG